MKPWKPKPGRAAAGGVTVIPELVYVEGTGYRFRAMRLRRGGVVTRCGHLHRTESGAVSCGRRGATR